MVLVLVVGCSNGNAVMTQTEETTTMSTDNPEEGKVFEGILEMDPVPGGKRFQGTFVVPDEGDPIMLSYRPMKEYFAYLERRVVIRGDFYSPGGPDVQQISAPHFRLDSMELAPGEQPIEPAPTELPAPPVVDDAASVKARSGRWAQIVGTMGKVEEQPNRYWNHGTLTLPDGTTELTISSMSRTSSTGLDGQLVTVVGRVVVEDHGGLSIRPVMAICPGRVTRCGMIDRPDHK